MLQMIHVSQLALASLTLYSAAVGVLLGAIYDIFRILRIAAEPSFKLKHIHVREEAAGSSKTAVRATHVDRIRFWIIFIEDIIFSLICAAVISITVFHLNTGHPRWFILLGAAGGFSLYYHTVGRLVMLLSSRIILLVRTIVLFVLKMTLFPLLRLLGMLVRVICRYVQKKTDRVRSEAVMRRMLARSEDGFGAFSAVRGMESNIGNS